MEVRIGVQNVAREITFESNQSADAVAEAVAAALKDGGALTLSDDKGRYYIIPANALGFVHMGDQEKGRVGFGTL